MAIYDTLGKARKINLAAGDQKLKPFGNQLILLKVRLPSSKKVGFYLLQ